MRTGYRDTDITVLNAVFEPPPHEKVPFLMKTLIDWVNNSSLKPIRKTCAFHLLFEVIHPFVDGNGRTGRILMNYLLIKEGLVNVGFDKPQEYIQL
ncbi:Fic family protein [Hydrogenobacter thermophilus]|uniref:Fic family protein n=1 Tax=Hydrogenobacter thermophilus TaxID=940 RepID=UPI0030F7D485